MNWTGLLKWVLFGAAAIAIWATDSHRGHIDIITHRKPKSETATAVSPPAVSVAVVRQADFVESVLVTGSLIAREEILVAPEVDGLRFVKKGDVLAVLETETLDAQLAQNTASLNRSTADVAKAKSQIAEVEARLAEAKASLDRAKPLTKSGYL